jgi:hypothetical protein
LHSPRSRHRPDSRDRPTTILHDSLMKGVKLLYTGPRRNWAPAAPPKPLRTHTACLYAVSGFFTLACGGFQPATAILDFKCGPRRWLTVSSPAPFAPCAERVNAVPIIWAADGAGLLLVPTCCCAAGSNLLPSSRLATPKAPQASLEADVVSRFEH